MRPTAATLLALLAFAAPAAAAPTPKLLPFPNNKSTVADKHAATGLRLDFQAAEMPRNKDGKPVDPTDIDRFDAASLPRAHQCTTGVRTSTSKTQKSWRMTGTETL